MHKEQIELLKPLDGLVLRQVADDGTLTVKAVFVCMNEKGDVLKNYWASGWMIKVNSDPGVARLGMGAFVHFGDLMVVRTWQDLEMAHELAEQVNADLFEFNRFFAGQNAIPPTEPVEPLTWEEATDRNSDRYDLFLKTSGRSAEEKLEEWQEPPEIIARRERFVERVEALRAEKGKKRGTRREESEGEWR